MRKPALAQANLHQQRPGRHAQMRARNVTPMTKPSQSLSITRLVEQPTAKRTANCCHHQAAARLMASEQTKPGQEGRHLQPTRCKIDLNFIDY